jgi:tetratricopeptide (TPR) repeat protein
VGYSGDKAFLIQKAQRNIHLLEQERARKGDDPYLLYQLGKSYYMMGDLGRACDMFAQALTFEVEPELEYVQDLVESYGYALINTGQEQTALGLESVYQEFCHTADFVFLMGLVYMKNGEFGRALEEFDKAVKIPYAKTKGTNGCLAYYNAGVICECLGRAGEAARYYEQAGQYPKAREGLRRIRADE